MKNLLASVALATTLGAAPALADDLTPQMDVTVIQQDSAATTGGIFVPIFAIILLLLLHTGNGEPMMYVVSPL